MEQIYGQFKHDLFAGVPELWRVDPEPAIRRVQESWTTLDKKYGRRRGHPEHKQALDVRSYECAAAFRRCYSAVWAEMILPRLVADCGLSRHSYRFLEHWHQLIVREGDGHAAAGYAFRGHCLG